MQDWTILVTSLSAISGVVLLASCFVTARFTYRRTRRGKASTDDTGPERPASPSVWLSGYLPEAQAGPNGTVCVLAANLAVQVRHELITPAVGNT